MTQSQGGGNRRPALRRSGGGRRGGEWRETADGAAAPRLDGDGGGRGQHGGRRDHQPRPHGGGARATCSRDAEGQRLSCCGAGSPPPEPQWEKGGAARPAGVPRRRVGAASCVGVGGGGN
jgi:hypothetical protein